MMTSRIILTFDCLRSCEGCCNTDKGLMDQAITVDNLEQCVTLFDEIILTGGEPLLYPDLVNQVITEIRERWNGKKIYLYTTIFTPELKKIVDRIDGVHYTLHEGCSDKDVYAFLDFQRFIAKRKGSFRAYIDPRVKRIIHIYPSYWTRVEVKPWLDNCPLPSNETLFIYGKRTTT